MSFWSIGSVSVISLGKSALKLASIAAGTSTTPCLVFSIPFSRACRSCNVGIINVTACPATGACAIFCSGRLEASLLVAPTMPRATVK